MMNRTELLSYEHCACFYGQFHQLIIIYYTDILTRVKILPMSASQVDLAVSSFRQLGDEVRRNVPDLLLAAMTALHSQYRGGSGGAENIREKAKSLITYAGMIPYRLPGDTNARLVQMEVQMN